MLKIVGKVTGVIVLIIAVLSGYFLWAYPAVGPAPEIKVEGTPDQIKRGKYLANHVTLCVDCHSTRDWSIFSGPITPGTEGQGGEKFGPEMGFPGTFYSRNITPHNLGDWTDGEIYRAITSGVSKDGSPLFPVMPYPSYKNMAPRDVKAIIAYIRTLQTVAFDPPASVPDFPLNLIMRTMPADPVDSATVPSPEDPIKYGKYLTTIAACSDCHTPKESGAPVRELLMAGGMEFRLPGGTVRSANLTPHPETGIGRWSKEQFVAAFKQYNVPSDSLPGAPANGYNTVMPWNMYAGMKEQDLEAIYTYLQTLEPKENAVEKFTFKN